MASAAWEAGQLPHSKTGRAGTARPVQNFHGNNSAGENSLIKLQMQRLQAQFGLTEIRAALVAALAFGGHI